MGSQIFLDRELSNRENFEPARHGDPLKIHSQFRSFYCLPAQSSIANWVATLHVELYKYSEFIFYMVDLVYGMIYCTPRLDTVCRGVSVLLTQQGLNMLCTPWSFNCCLLTLRPDHLPQLQRTHLARTDISTPTVCYMCSSFSLRLMAFFL
jgi:hypothetical protein